MVNVKVNVFPVHALKAYRGSGGVIPFILNLGAVRGGAVG
jgi:hypothetical protein